MKRTIIILLAIIVVLGAWGICFHVTKSAWICDPAQVQTYGVFGDSFGTVNALFSGLAFVGITMALIYQIQDTKHQRKEFLVQTRISACAAIIEAEKTLSDYYQQAVQNQAPAPVPDNPEITWADMIQHSRKRIHDMSAELEKARITLMQEQS